MTASSTSTRRAYLLREPHLPDSLRPGDPDAMARAAIWKRRVAEWKSSGLKAAESALGRVFAASTLIWWSSRLNRSAVAIRPAAVEGRTVVPLARVVREERSAGARFGTAVVAETPVVVEDGPVRLLLRRGFDPRTPREVQDGLNPVHGANR